MQKFQFLSQLTSQPWDMDKLRARSIIGSLLQTLLRSERPSGDDLFGDPLPCMQLIGNAAVIPITGILSINVPDWIKSYGINLTDANDIAEEVDQALADPNVELIVQDCDSPGGMSLAGDKLFSVFEAANRKKPVFAWVGDGKECCSAAYNAAAPAQAILAGPFASAIGCIGSYLTALDDTGMYDKMGISIEVFRSGAFKGIGEDALSGAQRDYLQSMVDEAGASIRAHVQKYRTEVSADDLQGQYYAGVEAAARGFAAGTAKNREAALAKFRKLL